MTTYTPAIDVSHDQTQLPNQSFSPWLRGQTTLFISQISAVLGFVLFLASLVYYVSHASDKSEWLKPLTVKLIVDYVHVVFMAVFILVLIQVLDDNERGSYRVKLVYERVFNKKHEDDRGDFERRLKASKEQLKKFKRLFLLFWIGMLFLYVFFACQHSYELATSEPEGKSVQSGDISFSTTNKSHDGREEHFRVDVSFSTTDKAKTLTSESNPPKPKPLVGFWEVGKQLAFPFIVFSFNNLTLLFIFWCFLVLHLPADEMEKDYRKFRNGSALIVLGLTLLFFLLAYIKGSGYTPDEWKDFIAVFDALSGVLNAIVLALLISRLDSKLIGLPSWLISILYSYAAVQPLFMVFELSQSKVLEKIATSVLIFVFVSKIYFFLIIIYALQTGKMLNYLVCFPILRDRAKECQQADKYDPENPGMNPAAVSDWLRSDRPLWISMWIGLAAICYFFISLVGSIIPDITSGDGSMRDVIFNLVSLILRPPNVVIVVIDCAQLVAVLVMIRVLSLVLKENGYGLPRARATAQRIFSTAQHIFNENLRYRYSKRKGKRQLKKFKRYFLYFWCATFILYVVLLLDHKGIIIHSNENGSIAFMVEILLYPFLEFSFATLNLLFIFWCFVVLRSPAFNKRTDKRQKLLVNYSGFVVALLIAGFPLLLFRIGSPKLLEESDMRSYATVFDGVTGTLSAVVLALLIARMDSKFFGLSPWLIGMLFAYAAIQPLFVAFALNVAVLKMVQTSVLTTALGLKICFFLIVAHSLQSGKVLNYLVCFPFLKERVDSIFENQFEIRLARAENNSFTFSILKKNELHYSTAIRLQSKEACDKFVRYLREQMKERKAYLPPPKGTKADFPPREEAGTHWVELRSDNGKVICESSPLKSEEEAHDLIAESMDKIPYCKYNRT
jgi:hypothetical protein